MLLTLLSMTLLTATVHAQPEASEQPDQAEAGASCPVCGDPSDSDSSDPHKKRWRGGRMGLNLIPRYQIFNHRNFTAPFVANGFDEPGKERFGFGLQFYRITRTNWQLGLSLDWLGTTQERGGFEAMYHASTLGFYFAKDFVPDPDFDLTLGSVVGWGYASIQVFSAAQNGRFSENAVVLEPLVGAFYRIQQWLKLGVQLSYKFPFAQSSRIRGDDLGVDQILPQGASVGLVIALGKFDLPKE